VLCRLLKYSVLGEYLSDSCGSAENQNTKTETSVVIFARVKKMWNKTRQSFIIVIITACPCIYWCHLYKSSIPTCAFIHSGIPSMYQNIVGR